MKRLIWIVPLLLVIGTWLYFKYSPGDSMDGLALVPSDALYVIDSEEPIESWKVVSNHSMWQGIKSLPYIEDLTDQANYLDTLIADNNVLFKALGHRRLIISAHKTTRTDYDFLFIVDLKNTGKKNIALNAIRELYKISGYTVTEKDHKGIPVYSSQIGNTEPFHFTQYHHQLICSYKLSFLFKALSDKPEKKLVNHPTFEKQFKQFTAEGLGQVYFNYNQLEQLAMCYLDDGLDVMHAIGDMLEFSTLNLHQNDQSWLVEGITSLDTVPSFLSAALSSPPKPSGVTQLLSHRTAWYLSLTFPSFSAFQEQLFKADDDLKASYETTSKRLEQLLNFSMEEHLTSWIGTEVAVAQMRKNKVLNKDDNYVVLLRTKDRDMAELQLNYVAEQVKARTPAQFKQIEYRNHVIQYLDIKGFFKTFLGKAFDKIQKPYYLILEDYVVFSNSPYTLVGMIEDYENKQCLKYDNSLPEITTSNLTLYYSPGNLHPALTPLIHASSRKNFAQNRMYFNQFSHGLITLKKHGDRVTTQLSLQQKINTPEESTIEDDYDKLYRKFALERDINNKSFVLEWIQDGVYIRRFPGSEAIAIEASTKKGVLHGSYKEFDKDGKVVAEGKYKNGQKKGTWKYYHPDGNTSKRKF